MSDILIAEILLLLSLLPVILRSVFIRSHRIDSIVLITPVVFCISILLWFVYGLSLSVFCVTVFVFIVLLSNFRALIRYFNTLFVDYYSYKFRIAMFLEGLILLVLVGFLVFFAPIATTKQKTRVFSGSCSRGFVEREGFLMSADLFLTEFCNETISENDYNKPVVLYIPQVYSTTYDASPRLNAIAKKGYKVVSVEFYTDDISCFGNFLDARIFRPWALRMLRPTIHFEQVEKLKETSALELVSDLYGETILYKAVEKGPTPLMDDLYLTRPLEAWVMDRKNYKNNRVWAKNIPELIALDVEKVLVNKQN